MDENSGGGGRSNDRPGWGDRGCGFLGCLGTFVVLAVIFAGFGAAGQIWASVIGIAISIVVGFAIAEMMRRRRLRRLQKS